MDGKGSSKHGDLESEPTGVDSYSIRGIPPPVDLDAPPPIPEINNRMMAYRRCGQMTMTLSLITCVTSIMIENSTHTLVLGIMASIIGVVAGLILTFCTSVKNSSQRSLFFLKLLYPLHTLLVLAFVICAIVNISQVTKRTIPERSDRKEPHRAPRHPRHRPGSDTATPAASLLSVVFGIPLVGFSGFTSWYACSVVKSARAGF